MMSRFVSLSRSCTDLATVDIMQLCGVLSDQISGLRTLPVITAIVGVLGAALAAWLTTRGSHKVQKTERFNKAQREALIDSQNLALRLRRLWLAYSSFISNGRIGDNPFSDEEQSRRIGQFKTALVRIDDEPVRQLYSYWHDYAEQFFSGNEDYQSHEEQYRWDTAIHRSGVVLRQLDK